MFDIISSVGNETSKTVLNFLGGAEQEAWEYMAVCVPIVVFCAPMGSLVASYFHRQGICYKEKGLTPQTHEIRQPPT